MSDWRDRALAAVEKSQKKSRLQTTNWGSQFHVRLTPEFKALLRLASEARGITIVGYVRRAVAKQLAKDFEMEWKEVIALTPYPSEFGKRLPEPEHRVLIVQERRNGRPQRIPGSTSDDGTGFGDWS